MPGWLVAISELTVRGERLGGMGGCFRSAVRSTPWQQWLRWWDGWMLEVGRTV